MELKYRMKVSNITLGSRHTCYQESTSGRYLGKYVDSAQYPGGQMALQFEEGKMGYVSAANGSPGSTVSNIETTMCRPMEEAPEEPKMPNAYTHKNIVGGRRRRSTRRARKNKKKTRSHKRR